ncbi:hypothetical protein HC776_02750 [bacterium]|nr:hypothetical protein [bacterium]
MPETTQFGDMDGGGLPTGTLKPNTVLLARYKIDAVLGGGGQGAVYRARDLNFPEAKRLVAVKEMHVSNSDPNRSAAMRTFQREANILATLAHPAIPKIYDLRERFTASPWQSTTVNVPILRQAPRLHPRRSPMQ